MHSPDTYPARRIWFALTAVLIALGSGHFYASDEENMFGVTLRMWQAIRHLFDTTVIVNRPILTPYGPMQSLLALLTLPVGSALAWLGPNEMSTWLMRLPSTWINAVMVANIAVLLGWISLQRGYTGRVAIWVALSYALATPALKYASTFFSEPTASWWLLLAALPVLVGTPLRTRTYVICGLACLGAILSKIAVAPTVALIGMLVMGKAFLARDWRMFISWGSGAVIAGVIFLSYNLLARGDLLSSGYVSHQSSYAIDWELIITGIHGQFLSSGKSIFLYAPVLFLMPIGLWRMRQQSWLLATVLLVIAGIVLVHTNVVFWHGDGAWGPRYVMLCLPFMCIPLADAYTWLATQAPRVRRGVVWVLVGATVFVQIAALAINFNTYIIDSRSEAVRFYTPSASPIIGQWQILVRQLGHALATWQAPGVTLTGWTYSEGDRANGAQFPRFAGRNAHIAVIPRGADWPMLDANYHTCFDPSGQLPVSMILNTQPLGTHTACPPRIVHLLLPRAYSTLTLTGDGVHIDGLPQHDWYERLTVTVIALTVRDAHGEFPVYAPLTPPSRMPNGANAMRIWASDSRAEFFDLWWYYLLCIPTTRTAFPVVVVIVVLIVVLAQQAWRTTPNHR